MSILILGKGFVGARLFNHLSQKGFTCTIISKGDLNYTLTSIFSEFLDNNKFDLVINCSGYTGVPNVDACEEDKEKCYNYNVLYPVQVLTACTQRNIPVIHIGSGCIYSGYDKEYTENDTPNFGMFSSEASYYSKCKHIFETIAQNFNCYVLRIRIPFTADWSRKNYFTKLLNYNSLISLNNSITSITDFNEFIVKFIEGIQDKVVEYGVYNIVNPEPVTAEQVVTLLRQNNIVNPNWNFIHIDNLDTKAKRSNCVLSTAKISSLNMSLPSTFDSLERDIKLLSNV